jgi:prevent-host-death family protein
MTKTVGSRELKTRLGSYLRQVQAGATLVVTDRGRPVAELRPVAERADEDPRLTELVALGVVTRPSGRPRERFEPLEIPGRPLSETLREDRF